jgi:serine/threonine protein kinase
LSSPENEHFCWYSRLYLAGAVIEVGNEPKEVWLLFQGKNKITHRSSPDLWAIGCTLYFFLYGASPFMAATDYLMMQRVKALDYSIPEQCDPDAASLIRALLVGPKSSLYLNTE